MSDVVELITKAVSEIEAGDEDAFGTLRVVGNDDLWVQYLHGTINARYPFDDDTGEQLAGFDYENIEECVPDGYVWLEIDMAQAEIVAWIERYFREILGCADGYELIWDPEV